MKKKQIIQLTVFLTILLLSNFKSFSQNPLENETEEIESTIPAIEKVYLHTDRSYYNIGESLWYKAYSVYAYTNVLFDHSNLLYVELISPESKIITRNITRIENGLGHGDIKLTDSIGVSEGIYQLRAYTNWSRNFGDDFVFKKEIEIIGLNEKAKKDPEKKDALLLKTDHEEKVIGDNSSINVQFFPEGGSLINGVTSFVGFKATNKYGNPIDIKGRVIDSDGAIVALLKSTHDGMGKFALTPSENKTYIVKIMTSNEMTVEVSIPKAEKQGYVLSTRNVKGKNIITIKTNEETLKQNPDAPLTMICTSKGITYFEGTQSLSESNLSFLLPDEDFPEGIAQITLYDETLKPHSERLVYIEKKQDVHVSIKPNKTIYRPKEKTTLEISAKTEQGSPIAASFSLAATDVNGVYNKANYSTSICSYYLMESDIKGRVNNPGYYFDTSNPKRLRHLDLLLLTQGWRDFLWKKLPKPTGDYDLEKGIKISGIVKQLLGNEPKANSSVRMVLMNNGKTILLNETTDVNGKFKFDNMVFTGATTMMLNTQNEKGKNRGMFILDSLHRQPLAIKFKPLANKDSITLKTIRETIRKKHFNFNVPIENLLDEVLINAKKKEDKRSKFGMADHTYVPKENGPHFTTIQQLIQFSIPGIIVTGNNIKFSRSIGPALILIDGSIAEMEDLNFVLPDDVSKIESLNSARAAVFGSRGGNGAILIYTKEGSIGKKKLKTFHSITKDIQGFYNARVFYTPNDEDLDDIEDEKEAIRNTLYWNPYVHPSENGTTNVTYYNSEVNTKVKVTLEGITDKGMPIVVKTFYTIENE